MYHVLYISNEATLGGAAQSLLNMLKVVKDRRVHPVVILPDSGVIEENLNDMEITYYIIPFTMGVGVIGTGSQEKDNTNFVNNYEAALKIREIIQTEKIDLVHINSSVSNVGAFAALLAGIPYVWHFREFPEEDFECEFWDKPLKIELMKQADATVAVSHIVLDLYNEKYDIAPICIYNGIDVERYKTEWSLISRDETAHNFIITGALSKNKGQYDAVKAVEILLGEGVTNIHLTLVGYGSEGFRWFLKKYIQQHELEQYVTILSFQKDLSAYREKCSYALTTSKMEALGRCTIEAMLAGNIVIGADTGGTKEIIGEDETRGYLYRQGDVQSLAAVMKRVMAEAPQVKDQCRKNAQKYAEETFSLEWYGDKILSLYEEVLTRKKDDQKRDKELFVEKLAARYEQLKGLYSSSIICKSKYQLILQKWISLAEQGKTIADFLRSKDISTVAIYGMGNLGCKLYDELIAEGIRIPYFIDRNSEFLKEVISVKSPEDEPVGVDAVIVAVSGAEESIASRYRERYGCCVMGISEILDDMSKAFV